MAKKAVATFKAGEKIRTVKCIRMEKSQKTGAYVFVEQIVLDKENNVKDFFDKK